MEALSVLREGSAFRFDKTGCFEEALCFVKNILLVVVVFVCLALSRLFWFVKAVLSCQGFGFFAVKNKKILRLFVLWWLCLVDKIIKNIKAVLSCRGFAFFAVIKLSRLSWVSCRSVWGRRVSC